MELLQFAGAVAAGIVVGRVIGLLLILAMDLWFSSKLWAVLIGTGT